MNYKLANEIKMWKENENITTLLVYLKGIEIFQRRGKVNTIVMEHFMSIFLQKSGPANKQHTYQYQSLQPHHYSIVFTTLCELIKQTE